MRFCEAGFNHNEGSSVKNWCILGIDQDFSGAIRSCSVMILRRSSVSRFRRERNCFDSMIRSKFSFWRFLMERPEERGE